ncbi:aminotransferase class V-fold PLP-dependent enzyme [Paraburkholderia caballeronis]|uniref:L-seryl-tRNA(Sec) selenium transferase n=1 Tax=Paraburkholderia caballeronis TaxID=416943 RepID=A0A1H7RLB6_9BURK|nr:aminotransferase class V-fold PLP-dependent enzyme [Paraburkholderia caballeronis]PXW23086.1 L-seryl-tRNA(Sec) selenium transferase [Paraburkholderia caballeronis]PXW97750.1 L-seryl-tRNA(Sec) selenium transferase [Paraburkholderia caballeronis]RAJ94720.1 L-seryl-tRNA(Sec) selenium transferase [Paraburkholderia caballeronis]SEE83152.1 L-seryl-tRNA(Sec) selenium transferase [Paraburkholderia caballeronis]SEL60829.1 L-seryl-tRNA(Sec) selenium transferase [Paraburkholderia caballeronis]
MATMDIRSRYALRPVINVSGTMTSLGASMAVAPAVDAVAEILPQFVEIDDLQRRASAAIAAACGSEAGYVTASCSAAITLTIAATMTGDDLGLIERLPDTRGLKNEVVVQTGHLVNYGAPLDQAIRLSGAKVVPVGAATEAHGYQLAAAINDATAAALFVVSHHTQQYGMVPFEEFVAVAHDKGVPVIVDAASEYDLTSFIRRGADIVLYSAHKFLGGPTAGIVAGRKPLVRAAWLQNGGIGRGFKVGKEGIAGAIAALHAWATRDHAAVRARERGYLDLWLATLNTFNGIRASIDPDPTGNPLDRLKVHVDAGAARITAWDLVDALANPRNGERPVIARDHEVEQHFFFLDPCNLKPGEEAVVMERLVAELTDARHADTPRVTPFATRDARRTASRLRWPD